MKRELILVGFKCGAIPPQTGTRSDASLLNWRIALTPTDCHTYLNMKIRILAETKMDKSIEIVRSNKSPALTSCYHKGIGGAGRPSIIEIDEDNDCVKKN